LTIFRCTVLANDLFRKDAAQSGKSRHYRQITRPSSIGPHLPERCSYTRPASDIGPDAPPVRSGFGNGSCLVCPLMMTHIHTMTDCPHNRPCTSHQEIVFLLAPGVVWCVRNALRGTLNGGQNDVCTPSGTCPGYARIAGTTLMIRSLLRLRPHAPLFSVVAKRILRIMLVY